ncbi:MAG: IclR family transcriptional regulator [Hyphomonadaceae bacterium]
MSVRSIKSCERTLALFELFSVREEGLTVGQVYRELGIPQPSASMLLRNLTAMGYLCYDQSSRTFRPTLRIALLGGWINRKFSEAGEIADCLSEMQARIGGETVFIATQNGPSIQYIATMEPERPDRLRVQTGGLRPLTCTAAGRVLLSLKTDSEIRSWVRRCNAEVSEDRHRVRESEFLPLIHRARAQGYAITSGESIPGMGAVAMVAPSPLGDMPLAIGAGGALARMNSKIDLMIEQLYAFKARLEKTNAWREPGGSRQTASHADKIGLGQRVANEAKHRNVDHNAVNLNGA